MAHGLATSRQTLAAANRLPSGSRTQNQRTIAEHVLRETISLKGKEAAKGPVQFRRNLKTFTAGSVIVHQGEFFYLVESRVAPGRFYVVVADIRESAREAIQYHCSSSDERVTKKCVNAVKATQQARDYFAA